MPQTFGWSLVATLAVGCKFSPGSAIDGSVGDGQRDAPADARPDAPPDAPPACAAAGSACVGDSLSTCAGPGATPVIQPCGWGCSTTPSAHCEVLVPTGGIASSGETVPGVQGTFTMGSATVDTDTGAITGNTSGTFAVVLVNGNPVLFQFGALAITGPVTFTGGRPAILVANGDVTIDGLIDVEGACSNGQAGPGGGAGGTATHNGGNAPGVGQGGGQGGGANDRGGAGGGYGGTGGNGGTKDGNNQDQGGAGNGMATIAQLCGGGGGGGGGNGGDPAVGGGGGGGLQLISNTQVTITSTGAINAGGCGGENSQNTGDGAAGGGAGGTIVIEAPAIMMGSGAVLAANGGAGGGVARGNNNLAQAGQLGSGAATGAHGGGDGGDGSAANGVTGASNQGGGGGAGGGGGGAVGRIRFNTRDGGAFVDDATLSPPLGTGTCTQGSATAN